MKPLEEFLPACRQRYRNERPNEFIDNDCLLPDEFVRLCPWEATYLYDVACTSRVGVVEIGRFYGGSTILLAGATDKIIHSFDNDPQDDDTLARYIDMYEFKNVNLYVHDSFDKGPPQHIDYDILFIDGDHSYEGVTKDMEAWYPYLKKGGHVLFHDSYMKYNIPEAIVDFTQDKHVQFFLSPYNPIQSWQRSTGTMCHFQKLED